ncbi:hypothetical protein [uncultured Aquimarina sp.]|uniref:hypothetical protein n=1 Tax=uncultured Aquimarina sp. TaxID=575652 RepID=UPI002613A91A|nr:hypothetical protein [uncultured Aquimarina sp.]
MNLTKQKVIFPLIVLQIVSCIWYLLPSMSHTHVPGGFIRMLIFGGIALVLLVITTILYFMYKPTGLLWKIPFVISIGMILLAWFYSK